VTDTLYYYTTFKVSKRRSFGPDHCTGAGENTAEPRGRAPQRNSP